MQEWVVPGEETGSKLIAFLVKHLDKTHSARYLKRAIENNRCQINGRTERFASTVLGKGDHISLKLDIEVAERSTVQFDPKRIIFEDQEILVYNKPPGINCDKSGIEQLLKGYCSSVQLVHRLDRDTTGVLILSKNLKSHESLLNQFKEQMIQKQYRAIVDGVVRESAGVIDNLLGRKKVFSGQTIWGAVKKDGSHARTDWKKLKDSKKAAATLLSCFPQTGRTHQIRVHMAEMGHPILGDFQYGKEFQCDYRPDRYLLHAEQVELLHPATSKRLVVQAPLPEDFKTAETKLFGN